MKIAFVMVGTNIDFFGARRVAAVTRKIEKSTDIFFITIDNQRSIFSFLNPKEGNTFSSFDADIISEKLACYDIVCFSSMTNTIGCVFLIVKKLRERSNKIFTLLGGVHATLSPNDSIDKFDAICIGDGEKPMQRFLESYKDGKDYYNIKGLWFNKGGAILKNPQETLNSNDELNEFQIGYDGFDSFIYDVKKKNFSQFTKYDYLEFNGLGYFTAWVLGCPYICSYCSNSGFASIDKNYRKIRYSKPEVIIREIEEAIVRHPYISTINIFGDNSIMLPFDVLEEFCDLYKSRINLPFSMTGIHPNTINKEKVELLASCGMIETSMGIQSGNERSLKLYDRNTSFETISRAVGILADAQKKYNMIPPYYDVIIDNPMETKDDIVTSLQFYNNLKRPFFFSVFSLCSIPGTKLSSYFEENNIKSYNSTTYRIARPTLNNALVYLISCFKVPDWIFEKLLSRIKGYDEKQQEYPLLLWISRTLKMFLHGFAHLKKLNFSAIAGRWLYWYWKLFGRKKQRFTENTL